MSSLALRFACLIVLVLFPQFAFSQVKFLEQNWNADERQEFYTTTQGSRIMPYKWFVALETADGTDSFLRNRIPALGYISNPKSSNNPDSLPVGYVKDTDMAGGEWMGLNCSACHTNQIAIGNAVYQIDGAPTLADMWGMLEGLDESISATRADAAKYERFERKVLGTNTSRSKRKLLKEEFAKFALYWKGFVNDSRVTHPWGRARLDAFGMIFNRVLAIDLKKPINSRPPDAPVSYPFLWGTSFEDRVQWNGSAENHNDVERLGRNVGEVLGVFGEATFEPKRRTATFVKTTSTVRTSAKRLNQVKLENLLKKLWSPNYPGPINQSKMQAGKVLFDRHCVSCHEVVPHGQQDRRVNVVMTLQSEVKTDPKMVENAALGEDADMGPLRKVVGFRRKMPRGEALQRLVKLAIISPYRDVSKSDSLIGTILSNDLFEPDEIAAFLSEMDLGSTEEKLTVAARKLVEKFDGRLEKYFEDLSKAKKWDKEHATNSDVESPAVLAYKARPLDGIWATAPYLHNGSVPNLYELLLPGDKRTKTFHVGSNKFDSEKVGFSTNEDKGTTLFDTSLEGNSNAGHDMYGEFDHDERMQLVEYMKSL